MADRSGFLRELQRRHVWRVAVAYAIVAWLLVQVAAQVFPFFDIPNWAVRLMVLLLALGFPVAVAFAWVYELTPEGIRRTEPADSPQARPETEHRRIGRKLDAVIIGVLVLAVILLLGNQFLWHKGMRAAAVAGAPSRVRAPAASATPLPAAATAAIPEKSVAVLPFANESGDRNEQFFSDGLSDDLINALSQFDGLKVISRNSAFQFRNSKESAAAIGNALGVAHLLEGSVQRAGDAVRITATLVNAADGSILWSQRYDKPYQDLFALQDAITESVAAALKAKLLTAPGAVAQNDRPPSGNLDAYTAYQRGISLERLGTDTAQRHAIGAFNEAIRLDPRYASAYAKLSGASTKLAVRYLTDDAETARARIMARKASDTALALDPDLSLAHLTRATLLQRVDMDWRGSEAESRRALQLSPNDAEAQFELGNQLSTLGHNRRAVELTRQALSGDPRNASWHSWLSVYLAALGQLEAARTGIDTAIALQPDATYYRQRLATIEILRGDTKAALAAAQQESPGIWRDVAMALSLQVGSDREAANAALANLIRKYTDPPSFQIARVYALRRDPDNLFKWLDRAWAGRDPGIGNLLWDPFILRYRDDPRFAAFCKKVGLPTTTDAVAMK